MVDPVRYEDALEQVQTLVEEESYEAAGAVLRGLHPADAAEVLAELEGEEQAQLMRQLETEQIASVF